MPLYLGGLCDAVIMKPMSTFLFLVRKARTGVGKIPNRLTDVPPDSKPEVNAFSIIKPEGLVSLATNASFAFEKVAEATPICSARTAVKSALTRPRTPELPNNFNAWTSQQEISECLSQLKRVSNENAAKSRFCSPLFGKSDAFSQRT